MAGRCNRERYHRERQGDVMERDHRERQGDVIERKITEKSREM